MESIYVSICFDHLSLSDPEIVFVKSLIFSDFGLAGKESML